MKTKEELIEFEKGVKQMFLDGELRSPVHLSGGNEDELIEIFKEIRPQDWVFTTYRSHYHALLKGVPEEDLKRWVLENKSIHFMSDKYKIFSSAIVGGCLPIALGVAMAIKKKYPNEYIEKETLQIKNHLNDMIRPHVWIFIGDMAASIGVFNDCLTYAMINDLPITFVIEDNGMSTDTKTYEAWGMKDEHMINMNYNILALTYPWYIRYYKYKRTYPHYGVGQFVKFK
jgi:TPP-dependent pyruvate/acetoin dehydrogenase alpha subunit